MHGERNPAIIFRVHSLPGRRPFANDLKREPEGIYTYDQKNERIFQRLNTDDDFEIMRELLDEQGRPKWQLKTRN